MSEKCLFYVGGSAVGTIENIQLDWPHFLGDFEPMPLFESVREIFSNIVEFNRERRVQEFHEGMTRLFQIGVEIKSLDGTILFKRKGNQYPGDIAVMFIQDKKISFRVFPKNPG
jgi:hypothetical protein